MESLLLFIGIAACGVLIGTLSGMFGIGGGTMIVPLLRLAFGLPVTACTATSLFTMIPTSLSGAFNHIRLRTASLKTGLAVGLGGFVFSPLGVWLGQRVDPRLVIVGVTAVIVYSAWSMLSRNGRDAVQKPSDREAVGLSRLRLAQFALLGAIAGVMAGLLGVGGGFLVVPVLVKLFDYRMKEATPASLIAISMIALPTTAYNIYLGNVYYLQGLALMVGTVPGARIGAWLSARLPDKQLRYGFAALLVIAGLALLANELLA